MVVLFAKVEIPRHWRRWTSIFRDSRDACIATTTSSPAEYPNRIWPGLMGADKDTGTKSRWLSQIRRSLAPGSATHRQSTQSGNCFLLRSDKLLLIPFGFDLRFVNLYSKSFDFNFLKFKIHLLWRFSSSPIESIDFVILSSPGNKNNPQFLITSEHI